MEDFYNVKMALGLGIFLWLVSLITFFLLVIDYEIGGFVWVLFFICILVLLVDSYILLEIILDIYERKETNKKETNGVNEMNVEDTARSYRFNII